ncbi:MULTISPECIES: AAA family ATPase [unclassified Synechococcus]|uniref:AAA family ATPase n=1 Tax=unclassified Synechococcus TaxID=2626047 RepID=UPI00140E79C0|nr:MULTISPECIES: AAA family ATPase [unclassified Synechococcus]MCB4378305.1 AAA family ATPase [Synechococcus sp. MU1650]MCB4393412.1 AAA family ATPase [Synechococcus sp. PH41509]MCB4412623.1 AAA family ATPase [Synechococcus sp. MU1611]MCB4423179.1 AAA family ATPase [Synechococcus sp. HB1133]MCB4430667.1 AAA family ATPase [Synechococcus sp. HBA1120]
MGQDLFAFHGEQQRRRLAPLADRMRPRTLEEFEGQSGILADGRLLRRAIKADRVGNLILHGPPGVGKTTLARIIANHTRAHFSSLNAVLAGVKDLRIEVDAARQRLERHGLRTILFIDEVHRFNSAQQDALLPWVENGTVTLIGATTENPYFEVNKALVSRSRLFRLLPLEPKDLQRLLQRALADGERGYGDRSIVISSDATDHLVDVAGGDARSLLNALELAVESSEPDGEGVIQINLAIAEESIQQRAVLYDKHGDAHYDTISAFIKSLRGSDADAAMFWLARMVEAGENPRFIFRRMLIAAGEDIGLADPQAIVVVEACAAAFERVGLPEGLYPLAQAALYLAGTEKSNSVLGFFDALKTVRAARQQDVPGHLRDANRDGAAFGDGAGYRYPHAYAEHWVEQQYLPSALQGEVFWQPGQLGWEGERRERMAERRAAQLAAAAELAADQPLLLSSGPDRPGVDRWVQRQLGQEGERLQRLRERLWRDIPWTRRDRVLLLGMRSLIWAIDPLRATPEGGVTVLCDNEADRNRLEAQLDLLEPEHRPQLLTDNLDTLSSTQAFDWIGGRLAAADLQKQNWTALLDAINRHSLPTTGLRLLLSRAELGPAGALQQNGGAEELLGPVVAQEQRWLELQQRPEELLANAGWQLSCDDWLEPLTLPGGKELADRWLAEGSPYRQAMGEIKTEVLAELRRTLNGLGDGGLRLPMRHQLIKGNQIKP